MLLPLVFLEIMQVLGLSPLGLQTIVDHSFVLEPLCELLDRHRDMQLDRTAAAAAAASFAAVIVISDGLGAGSAVGGSSIDGGKARLNTARRDSTSTVE